ncbi:hypothetical protein ACQP2U_43725 (plasmid) [Nocardia sp. CA-084685]|uniref:hypothetical protein n=1 Tax=Nocardia sp. CA-084685 TaxID=3239970 RepID=UPI003D99EC5E
MTMMSNMDRHAQLAELTGLVLDSDPAGLSDTWPSLTRAGMPVINGNGSDPARNAELARVARHVAETEDNATLARVAHRIAEITEALG